MWASEARSLWQLLVDEKAQQRLTTDQRHPRPSQNGVRQRAGPSAVDEQPTSPTTFIDQLAQRCQVRRCNGSVVTLDLYGVDSPPSTRQPTAAVKPAVARIPAVAQDKGAGIFQRRQHHFLADQRVEPTQVAERPG